LAWSGLRLGGEALAVPGGRGLSPAAGGDQAEQQRQDSAASEDGPGGVAGGDELGPVLITMERMTATPIATLNWRPVEASACDAGLVAGQSGHGGVGDGRGDKAGAARPVFGASRERHLRHTPCALN
jgi:hypothetical protein